MTTIPLQFFPGVDTRQFHTLLSPDSREMSSSAGKQLDSTPPTAPVELTNGLTLSPRIKLFLTIHRADASVAAMDEWKLKRSLIDFLKTCFSHHPISLPEEDLHVRRFKDLKKLSRHDPVARANLFIRDLGFVVAAAKLVKGFRDEEDEASMLEKKFVECRKLLVEKMDGMEVNLEGVRFRVSVSVPIEDDFDRMKKEWEELYAFEAGKTRGLILIRVKLSYIS